MELDALSISIDPALPFWALILLGALSVVIVLGSIGLRHRGEP